MLRLLLSTIVAGGFLAGVGSGVGADSTQIIQDDQASWCATLAAKEVRRYIYVRTGQLLPIQSGPSAAGSADLILVATKGASTIGELVSTAEVRAQIAALTHEQYLLKTVEGDNGRLVLVVGGDDVGTLYAAYRLAERLGIRFYLHGDVIPDKRVALQIPELNETRRPLFKVRGIQPFHDFPEGPDWWNADTYKAVLGQLPKLGMNFFGLHTYPEGPVGPEPTVWIGPPEELTDAGQIKIAYRSRHFVTSNVTSAWGYQPCQTSAYAFGAAAMFDRDDYGADYMQDTHPWNEMPPERASSLFERFGAVLRDSFTFAHNVGIKTCVGTETPLLIPKAVRERLVAAGRDPKDPATIQRVYEGMFQRIKATYPIDYYWLWTPEGWTWREVKQAQIDATLADFQAVQAAAQAVDAPFQLATCGWVLGPPQNPSLFDSVLPKSWPLSCINRNVGHDPVEPGFAKVAGRPQWAIPWLEDDPALIIPQLWVGRMRRDAADSLRYGCDGLLGIHWRTRILGPNVAALAAAAWAQDDWKTAEYDREPPALTGSFDDRRQHYASWRAVPSDDFYRDWAVSQFGPNTGSRIGPLFARLDCRLPRPSNWVHGPGGLVPDRRPWERVRSEYAFVDEMRALRPLVRGAGNLERFDYWWNNFRYMRAVAKLNCTWAELNGALDAVKKATNRTQRKQLALREALPLRMRLIRELAYVHEYLLATVSTPGGMGTVANWQQHIIPMLLEPSEKAITASTGEALSPKAQLPRQFVGEPRLLVPVVRTAMTSAETLRVDAIVLGMRPEVTMLYWRPLGTEAFRTEVMEHVARGVYRAEMPGTAFPADFEYYVQVAAGDKVLRFPATAPDLIQTVIVMENVE